MYTLARKLFLSCTLALAAASVSAATVTATYTGTVGEGYDRDNQFLQGSDLAGARFSMVYIYDTNIGQYPGGPGSDQIQGGQQLAIFLDDPSFQESPMISALLTINGQDVYFSINTWSQVTVINDGTQNYISHLSGSAHDNENYIWITETSPTNAIPADLDAPLDVVGSGIDSPFERSEWDPLIPLYNLHQGSFRVGANEALGSLKVERLTITVVSSVPLPGALPLFLVALLGMGMLRRRHH